ncbi:MAG: CPBP family intramembrane metalloprotease [bacterium]|nr:CPBP family intramembrane metalloprotease [bacterium]
MEILNRYKKLLIFIIISYGITWLLWLPLIIYTPPLKFFHQIGSFGPFIGAFLTIILFDGLSGIRELVNKIMRFPIRWILFAFLFPFILFIIASIISFFIHGTWVNYLLLFQSQEYPTIGIVYWILSIVCYGFGEQVGWRGFVLPELIKNGFNAVYASTVIGILWALWHLPLFWYPSSGFYTMSSATILGWFMSLMLSSYLLTWIFNSSKKSLATVAIFHGTIDIVVTSRASEGDIVMIVSVLLMTLGFGVLLSGKKLEGFKFVGIRN